VEVEDLYIAAAVVRLERWRFDYGRKITPARIAHLPLNRDPELKSWINVNGGPKVQRVPVEK
jgi:hypothetical protein